MNSRSDVILPHKKFTWADLGGGYKYRYTPRRYAPGIFLALEIYTAIVISISVFIQLSGDIL